MNEPGDQHRQDDDTENERSDSDWGFSSRRPSMAKETRIGLLLILVLLGAFGFVVYRQYNKDGNLLATLTSALSPDKKPTQDDTNVIHPTKKSDDQEQTKGDFAYADDQTEPPQQRAVNPFERHNALQQATAAQRDDKQPSENPFEAYGRTHRHAQHSRKQRPHTHQPEGTRDRFGSSTKQHSHPFPRGTHRDEQQRAQQHGSHQHADEGSDKSQQPDSPQQDAQYDWRNLVAQQEPAQSQQSAAQKSAVQQDPFGSGGDSSQATAQQQQQRAGLASTNNTAQSMKSTPAQNAQIDEHHHSHGKDDKFHPFGSRLTPKTHQSATRSADHSAQQSTQASTDPVDANSARQQADSTATASPFGNHTRQSIASDRSHIARQRLQYRQRAHNRDWSTASSDRARSQSQDRSNRGSSSFHPNAAQTEQNSGRSDVTGLFDRRQTSVPSRGFEQIKRGTKESRYSDNRNAGVYIVQPKDNYWNISKKHYGTPKYFTALARYNEAQIPDPKLMRPGMKIRVPKAHILETRYPELCPHPSATVASKSTRQSPGAHNRGFFRNAAGHPMFHVAQHDTLTGIAKAHLGRASRWIQIYELNRKNLENPKSLKIGTDLRLPGDARPVRLVHSPRANR
jgi:nucleoid-associated protein YgaU